MTMKTILKLVIFVVLSALSMPKLAAGHGESKLSESDSSWTKEDRAIIAVAHKFLEERQSRQINALYRITRSDKKIKVYVDFVSGYDKDGRPVLKVGSYCTVVLDLNLKPLGIITGA